MIYSFNGVTPVVHESAYVHPQAVVTGQVAIGRDVYIGPGCALRGDWGAIEIADGCNVQENCTVHMFPGVTVVLEEAAHIGHGAIIHGARIGRNALVGMNAVVMDNAVIGESAIVAACAFVKAGMLVPPRMLVAGMPAKVMRELTDQELAWKIDGTRCYQDLSVRSLTTLTRCEPQTEPESGRKRFEFPGVVPLADVKRGV